MKKKIYFAAFLILFVNLAFSILGNKLQHNFFPSQEETNISEEKPISCAKNDIKCVGQHAKNLANQLTGMNVTFAMHQCAGPHLCTPPDQKSIEAATEAIRTYVRNPDLQVIPINGVTPAGTIYYCAKDDQCWKVDAKTNQVISSVMQTLSPTPLKPKTPVHP